MSYVELLPEMRALSRIDKLRLIQVLAEDLAQSEEATPFVSGQSFPLSSPDWAYDAAAVLLRELEAESSSGEINDDVGVEVNDH
jgi:hypothetical protein